MYVTEFMAILLLFMGLWYNSNVLLLLALACVVVTSCLHVTYFLCWVWERFNTLEREIKRIERMVKEK